MPHESQRISLATYNVLKGTSVQVMYYNESITLESKFWDLRDLPESAEHIRGIYYLGYELTCPKCKHNMMLDRRTHQVINGDNGLTVSPSLVCPYEECGWHVWIKDGEMTDC